jgi:hypothetical protein
MLFGTSEVIEEVKSYPRYVSRCPVIRIVVPFV